VVGGVGPQRRPEAAGPGGQVEVVIDEVVFDRHATDDPEAAPFIPVHDRNLAVPIRDFSTVCNGATMSGMSEGVGCRHD